MLQSGCCKRGKLRDISPQPLFKGRRHCYFYIVYTMYLNALLTLGGARAAWWRGGAGAARDSSNSIVVTSGLRRARAIAYVESM